VNQIPQVYIVLSLYLTVIESFEEEEDFQSEREKEKEIQAPLPQFPDWLKPQTRVERYWKVEHEWFAGVANPSKQNPGLWVIEYDDGEVHEHKFNEKWRPEKF
jgi:hypothetical protein